MSLNTSPTTTSIRKGKSGRELFHAAMLASTTSQAVLPTRQWQSESHLQYISRKISKIMKTCTDRRRFLRRFRAIKDDLKSVILPPSAGISRSQIMKDLLRERFQIEGKLLESHIRTNTVEPLIRYLKLLLIRERGTDEEISRVLEAMSRTNSGGTMYEKLCVIFGTKLEDCPFVVIQSENTPRATEISIRRDRIVVDTFHDFYVEFLGQCSSSSEEEEEEEEEESNEPITWRVLIRARVMELVATSKLEIRGRRVLRVDVANSSHVSSTSQDLEILFTD